MKNIFKKIVYSSLAITISLSSLTGCTKSEINTFFNILNEFNDNTETQNYINVTEITLDDSIEDLINNIKIEDATDDDYDRDEYTSTSQNYEYDNTKYYSIRDFAFYASDWYNNKVGVYVDPYTNEKLTSEKQTDFDHVVPLHYVNQHGGSEWSEEQKKAYADNPSIGVDVNSSDNRSKGDKGPSEWLPDENQEDYCYTWLVICSKYNISITQDDMNTIKSVLNNTNENDLDFLCEYK